MSPPANLYPEFMMRIICMADYYDRLVAPKTINFWPSCANYIYIDMQEYINDQNIYYHRNFASSTVSNDTFQTAGTASAQDSNVC